MRHITPGVFPAFSGALKELQMTNNKLKSLPYDFAKMSVLDTLGLSHNLYYFFYLRFFQFSYLLLMDNLLYLRRAKHF